MTIRVHLFDNEGKIYSSCPQGLGKQMLLLASVLNEGNGMTIHVNGQNSVPRLTVEFSDQAKSYHIYAYRIERALQGTVFENYFVRPGFDVSQAQYLDPIGSDIIEVHPNDPGELAIPSIDSLVVNEQHGVLLVETTLNHHVSAQHIEVPKEKWDVFVECFTMGMKHAGYVTPFHQTNSMRPYVLTAFNLGYVLKCRYNHDQNMRSRDLVALAMAGR